MTHMHEFCVDLACGCYSFKEINEAVERSYTDKAISRPAIYKICNKTKAEERASDQHNGGMRTADFVEAIRQFTEADRHVMINEMVEVFNVSRSTIHATFHEDLGLSLTATRWVRGMLTDNYKKKRICCCCLSILYQHMALEKTSVNSEYFCSVLSNFLRVFRHKHLVTAMGQCFLHMRYGPFHGSTHTQEFIAAKGIKTSPRWTCSSSPW